MTINQQSGRSKALWLIVTAIAAYCIGTSGWGAQPEILHSLIRRYEFKESSVGFLLSLELVAVSLTSFFLAPRIAGINLKRLLLYGGIVAATGHGVSATLSSVELLALSRTVAGVGEGCALAVANALIAASSDPQRNFGVMNAVNIAFATLFLALLTVVERHFGVLGVFGALATVCLVLMIPLNFIDDVTTGSSVSSNKGLNNPAAYSLLTAMFVWGSANAAMWAFMIQFAQSTDLNPEYISVSITTWAAGGFAGSSLAALLSKIPNRITADVINIGDKCGMRDGADSYLPQGLYILLLRRFPYCRFILSSPTCWVWQPISIRRVVAQPQSAVCLW